MYDLNLCQIRSSMGKKMMRDPKSIDNNQEKSREYERKTFPFIPL